MRLGRLIALVVPATGQWCGLFGSRFAEALYEPPVLRELIAQRLGLADGHITELKTRRNRFADQAVAVQVAAESRAFPDTSGYSQLQLLAGQDIGANHRLFQAAVWPNKVVLNGVTEVEIVYYIGPIEVPVSYR